MTKEEMIAHLDFRVISREDTFARPSALSNVIAW
ncbi:hypothetical protein GGQ72_003013 [Rhizobium rhizoryzae]|jgi:hypothetical protein|uniref:Uncharacterized protein n=1 Tax=Rhizobium rhizoryzae TaxID=451876 RepID=A0A7W6LHQ1_9HYPH|nr:hypothetical protein [Rhizobium rhizoryzae]